MKGENERREKMKEKLNMKLIKLVYEKINNGFFQFYSKNISDRQNTAILNVINDNFKSEEEGIENVCWEKKYKSGDLICFLLMCFITDDRTIPENDVEYILYFNHRYGFETMLKSLQTVLHHFFNKNSKEYKQIYNRLSMCKNNKEYNKYMITTMNEINEYTRKLYLSIKDDTIYKISDEIDKGNEENYGNIKI